MRSSIDHPTRRARFARGARSASVALVALATTLLPAVARAEPITLVGAYPLRTSADGTPSLRLPRADDDLAGDAGIDRADCESDERWSWAFGLPAGVAFTTLDAWASADAASCADPTARAGGGPSPRCWRVASFPAAAVANDGVVQLATTDLIKASFRRTNADDPSLTAKPAICEPDADMQPTRLFVHFLLMDATGAAIGGAASNPYESTYQTTFDLAGPDAPAAPSLYAGPLEVDLQWPEPSTLDRDFAGLAVYCTPGGVAPYVSSDGGATTCAEEPGAPSGRYPSAALEAHRCATTSAFGAGIQGLQPATSYTLRYAALDRYGNTGALAAPICGVSISGPLDYQPARTGSGGCALGASTRGEASRWALASGVLGALALAAAARRRARAGAR